MAVKDKGVAVTLVNPGPVDTDMMKAARGRMPLRAPSLAAQEVAAVIAKTTLDKTGAFFNFDGTEMPW
jgi:short-subunit dehydrogenase